MPSVEHLWSLHYICSTCSMVQCAVHLQYILNTELASYYKNHTRDVVQARKERSIICSVGFYCMYSEEPQVSSNTYWSSLSWIPWREIIIWQDVIWRPMRYTMELDCVSIGHPIPDIMHHGVQLESDCSTEEALCMWTVVLDMQWSEEVREAWFTCWVIMITTGTAKHH